MTPQGLPTPDPAGPPEDDLDLIGVAEAVDGTDAGDIASGEFTHGHDAEEHTEGHRAGRRLLNATAIMASGTMISRVLGFARAILLAFVLGNGTRQAEMFDTSTLIPNTLYMLFAGGALNTVLVPQIVRAIKNDSDGGQAFVNRIMTAFLAALAVVAALMTLAAPLALMLWTNASWRSPQLSAHYASLTYLTYLTMPQIFFYGAFFLVGQVLNAKDRFGPMMWAPIANNVIQILVLAGYVAVWGTGADTSQPYGTGQMWLLGLGSTLGIVVQTLILIPYMRHSGFHYRPRWDLKGTGLGRTFHMAKWMLGYTALTMIAQTVVWNLATSAVAGGSGGGGSAYNKAYLIWILPHSLLTVSLATAMLPSASRKAEAGDLTGVEQETTRAVELATTFLLPGSLGLLVLAEPITRLAFGHGQGADDAHYVAWALMAFAIGLVPYTIQYLYLRGFYAMEETRTPFYLQVVISGLNALLALAFVLVWNDPPSVAARLALSYSVAYAIGWWLSHAWLKKQLPTLSGSAILGHLRKVTLASLPAAALAWCITWAFGRFSSLLLQAIGLVVAAVVALLAFFFVAKRLHIAEATQLLSVLRRRGPSATEETPGKAVAGPSAGDPEPSETPDTATAAEQGPTPDALLAYPDPDDGHPEALEMPDDPNLPRVKAGDRIGRYRLDELLAVRGERTTWLAFDHRLSRAVLMHVLPRGDAQADDLLDRARRASAISDSRFLKVFDTERGPIVSTAAEPDFGAFIVYEYATGMSLEKILQSGPLSGVEAAWLTREVAEALVSVHGQGLFHERLNPDTVIVTAAGNIKIVGFLVEAALTQPETDIDPEDLDVYSLGKLLYACLVARWPGGARYGLAAAPANSGRLLTPSQVRAGVSRPLDELCDRILNPVPRNRLSRITTAGGILRALNTVLGAANAAHDLERRLRVPLAPFRTTVPPEEPAPIPTPARPLAHEVARPVAASREVPAAATTPDEPDGGESSDWLLQEPEDDLEHTAPYTPVPPPPAPAVRPLPRRKPRVLLIAAIALFLILLVGSIITVAGNQLLNRNPVATSTASPSGPAVLRIRDAADFDPTADGGSGHENARLVNRAIDDDPASAWLTERYRGNPKLGGLKPGVGLVIDLGTEQTVTSVSVGLVGSGSTVDLRVPATAAKGWPAGSQADWRTVASASGASGTITLTLDQPTTTRYLLIYLTVLPPEVGNYYQGGITGIEVRR